MRLKDKASKNKSKLIRTLAICLSFMGLGACMTIIGSSLLDLQVRIQEDFSTTSNLILVKSCGYFFGGLSVGFIEKYISNSLALFIGNILAGVCMIIAPWGTDFRWIASFIFVANIGQGLVDLYCNLSILHIWGDKGSNFMQILHMCFGIGSLITPIVTSNFYLPLSQESGESSAIINSTQNSTQNFTPQDVRIQWAFLIVGTYTLLNGVIFGIYCLIEFNNRSTKGSTKEVEVGNENEPSNSIPVWKKYFAVITVAILAHIAFGVEFILGNMAQAFGVKSELKMDKKSAALLVTAFWTCFAFFKVIFIPLALYFGEKRMTYVNLVIMLISVIIMVPHAAYNELCAWISFILLGIGYSPLFAIAYASLESHFSVTARQTAIIFVGGVMGESIHPPVIGHFIDKSPNIFIYYLGATSLLFVITMFILPIVCQKMFQDYANKPDLQPVPLSPIKEQPPKQEAETDQKLSVEQQSLLQ
ncbi:sodium-dependent glucose transporter 1C-like [Brevipalpus obovatus]|uniref:sodium-dependent glucose transporter 1C-like n=1 Tax=Brevipalpus obovatus TaxID=246614 RepID=UPI003D9E7DDE